MIMAVTIIISCITTSDLRTAPVETKYRSLATMASNTVACSTRAMNSGWLT